MLRLGLGAMFRRMRLTRNMGMRVSMTMMRRFRSMVLINALVKRTMILYSRSARTFRMGMGYPTTRPFSTMLRRGLAAHCDITRGVMVQSRRS
jgi:hypothetical protein